MSHSDPAQKFARTAHDIIAQLSETSGPTILRATTTESESGGVLTSRQLLGRRRSLDVLFH